MNAATLHPLARDYLKRLEKAAAVLPRTRRGELLAEIESHLSEALPAGASETEALNVLERLGEPTEIVAEAGAGLSVQAGLKEWLAIPLLLVGVSLFIVGWFVGVALLWSSRFWTLRDKLIGTLVLPGGLASAALIFAGVGGTSGGSVCAVLTTTTRSAHGGTAVNRGTDCTSSGGGVNYLGLTFAVLSIALPILTAIYLGRRATRAKFAA